jgi:dienelactone hydrolase
MKNTGDRLILKFSYSFKVGIIMLLYQLLPGGNLDAQSRDYQTYGAKDKLPVFYQKLADRQVYPLSWLQGEKGDFSIWRSEARAKVMECLLTPPPAVPFDPVVISEQDRGSYVARKVVLNISGDSRVLGFLLVPKSKGPHPAVLLLHDHGAKFDIGKEKVIEPWDEPMEKIASAKEYVNLCYGGRFIGDELAAKGYVCFATDMLNWSDRGGGGYEAQQALASNFFNLGMSFAGLIAHEDLRAAEFLSEQPEVDPERIAAMGLSVGGFRTWQVAALSEHIAAGVSVCWMSTYKGLMVPGNNQTGGNSAYTMVHPGLSHYLDYPDVASVACPKPMMFCCGNRDDLFPVESIKEAFAKMRRVWDSQNAGDQLVTKLYDSPHEYNLMMQQDAFEWLDIVLKNKR